MKSIILLKEGNYIVNGFADVMEAFNNPINSNNTTTLNYYTSSDVALHLHKNNSNTSTDCPVALAHFLINPNNPPNDISKFRPIDMDAMRVAADQYGIVLFGIITTKEPIQDSHLLLDSIFIVRDANNQLINAETKEPIHTKNHVDTIIFFSLSKLDNLPVYYLITDSHVTKIGEGFDFVNNDTEYRQITDHDGTIKDNLFTPTVTDGNVIINDAIFATASPLVISLFDHPHNIFKINNITDKLSNINIDVVSNFSTTVIENRIHINITNSIGYVKIIPKLGHLCDAAHLENPEFSFIIHRI